MYDLPMTQGLTGSENKTEICIKHFKGISKKENISGKLNTVSIWQIFTF